MKISTEDHQKLLELYKAAKEMPAMGLSTNEMLTKGTWADQAWDNVREYMDILGKKYDYDPTTHAIDKDGEIVEHE